MVVFRTAFTFLKAGFKKSQSIHPHLPKFAIMACAVSVRNISSMEVTKNISLLSDEKKNTKIINLKLERPQDKPLVVMLDWLMAKKKYVYKYADIYISQGYDVLNINISPWQLLWPTKGSQVVASDILRFLEVNTSYAPLVVHGFSVGGYVWGEALVKIAAEKDRYQQITDRVIGQVWDSTADITEIKVGLPHAVFPKNPVLQSALRKYILYHMKTFDKVATTHYIRSSQIFHTSPIKAPAQFFLSKSDPIGAESSNRRASELWKNMGMEVFWKCWDRSPHVGHFHKHPQEYIAELRKFLEHINASANTVNMKVQAKL